MPEFEDDEEYSPATTSPSEVVHEYMTSRRKITDPNDVIGLCSECKSPQPHSYMVNNAFAQEGSPVPCKFCGGVVIITYRELTGEEMNTALDYNRGIK